MDEWLMQGIPRTIAEDPDMGTVRRIRASITSDTGQVVESGLLLPCPFCGGRPYIQTHELDETCVEARVVCPSCHVSTVREYQSWKVGYLGDDLTRTLAIGRAISAWNRRAERTCRDTDCDTESITCSECGEITRYTLFWVDVDGGKTVKGHRPRFCSNCGRRVLYDSDDYI